MDVTTFRSLFPEFRDGLAYPSAAVDFWLTMAGQTFPAGRWGENLGLGMALYAAHNLSLSAQALDGSAKGRPAGAVSGPVSSKSVGSVSVSYDTGAGLTSGAGEWNLTSYGIRLKRLINLVGMGGVQL